MTNTTNILTIGNLRFERDYLSSGKPVRIIGKIDARIECTCPITSNTFANVELEYVSRGFQCISDTIDDLVQRFQKSDCSMSSIVIDGVEVKSFFDRKINFVDLRLDDYYKAQFEPIFLNKDWVINENNIPQLIQS